MTAPQGITALGFERFVAERGRHLWRAAWLLVADDHHAEDLVQIALTKTYGRYSSLNDDRKFEAYVRTTIYRTFVSWWRLKSWKAESLRAEMPEATGGVSSNDLRIDVLRALDSLPRMQRAVLVLRFFEDRSTAEVSETLGIAEGTVKRYVHRGCAALRTSPFLLEVGDH